MTSTKPNQLSLADAAKEIREGRLTSSQLVDSCLERIAEREPHVGAFVHLDAERARSQAAHLDDWRASGRGIGPLHGVPVAIKDIIDTADMPTQCGSPIYAGRTTTKDAACVAALRSAGAVILGKTVTTELALLTPSATKNPANTSHTPGGSSAGSAAAVADMMCPGALGTQTAGSVLRPASYCGIYGFKPTRGLISRQGVLMQSHTLDTVGVLARSIEDVALLTDCISAYDPDDDVSYSRSRFSLSDIATKPEPVKPVFAFIKTPAWDEYASPDMREAFAELAESLGDACMEFDIPGLDRVIEWQRLVQLAENAAYYGPLQDKSPGELSPGLNARLTEGAAVPVRAYLEAIASREKAYAMVDEIFEHFTAILTPAAPGTPPGLDAGITGSPIFNGLWTYLGMPCISVPVMEIDGLPLGVQVVGPRRDDARLLRTAHWLVNTVSCERQV